MRFLGMAVSAGFWIALLALPVGAALPIGGGAEDRQDSGEGIVSCEDPVGVMQPGSGAYPGPIERYWQGANFGVTVNVPVSGAPGEDSSYSSTWAFVCPFIPIQRPGL